MADTSDVEKALVGVCAGVLFPSGGYQEGATAASAITAAPLGNANGTPAAITCRLYRGWPNTDRLNSDLASGVAHVSVFPENGAGRLEKGFLNRWWQAGVVTPTLTATVAEGTSTSTVTFAGVPAVGQVVALAVGPGRDPTAYAHAVQAADTLTTIAAAIAALIPGATSAGATTTVPSNACAATVGQAQTAVWLTREISQRYRVMIWAASPWARDALGRGLDAALSQMFRLTMPDGTPALMRYGGTLVSDLPSRQSEWNRSLIMIVTYSTAATMSAPEMTSGAVATTASGVTINTTT